METVFLKVLNAALTSGWIVLAVLVLRLIFRRAPKRVFPLLWGMVALRLVFPFSFESRYSFLPSAEPVPREILSSPAPEIASGIPFVDRAVNPVLAEYASPAAGASVNPMQIWIFTASVLWLAGLAGMLLYALISSLLLRKKVATAYRTEDGVKEGETVPTPFVLGFLRPVIYLPSGMTNEDRTVVLAHERAHLVRLDHLWKPLGFLFLAVFWFQPLLWLAYILFCRDTEKACDERVIRDMEDDGRRAYSEALLRLSIRRPVSACPLAFGETGVKSRIRAVMHYKKPAFWVLILALAAAVLVTGYFLTERKKPSEFTDPLYKEAAISDFAESGKETFIREYLENGAYIGVPPLSVECTAMERMNTGTVGLTDGYELWYYYFRYHYSGVVTGKPCEIGIDQYFLFYYEDSGKELYCTPVCYIDPTTLRQQFGTEEMTAKYGNPYTAAAVELPILYQNEDLPPIYEVSEPGK